MNKKIISKKELIKKINKLLSKNKYSHKDNLFFELLINLYLILNKVRKLAQIYIFNFEVSNNKKKILNFLNKYYPFYFIDNRNKDIRILIYSQNYNLNKLNKSFTKKFAKDLGNFYVCAGDLNKIYKKYKYLLRPVIGIFYRNKNKKILECELYAQMCPPLKCIKNFDKFKNIKNKLNKIIKKLNKNLNVYFEVQGGF